MGNCFGLVRRRRIRRHIVLILIGLDNAGKTKTINNLAGENDDKVLPTVGFKAVNLAHKDTPVTIYDLGGGPQFRQIWSQYYSEVHGVIFVIDSSDFSRLAECKSVLEEVLSHDKISGKPVLVLANKQDKTGALDDIDVVEKLNIEPLVNKYRCPTLVESYSAQTLEIKSKKNKIDPGLRKGYHWLLNYIASRYGDINLRVQTDIHAELERRKRMLKAPSRASQTFTAVSDDIATQTGFENPNFGVIKDEKDLDQSLIVVKPARKPNSLDTTITIESVEDADNTGTSNKYSDPSVKDSDATSKDCGHRISNAKPKLSPLFGRASSTSNDIVRIDLEPRSEFRKLSPIAKKKVTNHYDFKTRPHSSPTFAKNKTSLSSKNSSLVEDMKVTVLNDLNVTKFLGEGARTWDPAYLKHRVLVNDVELSQMHREIIFTEREHANKSASSDVTPVCVAGAGAGAGAGARPASASQLVRRQLELAAHKRRYSLRYMHRNKTNPERTSMLIYEPKSQNHYDKGDFEQSATIN